MYLGQHVRIIDNSIAPILNGKTGVIAKVKPAKDAMGHDVTVYRVYVEGHPVLEWLTEDYMEPVE